MIYMMLFGFMTTVRSSGPHRNLKQDASVKTWYITCWTS